MASVRRRVNRNHDKSNAVAGKPRDATVNFDPYISNTINSIVVVC